MIDNMDEEDCIGINTVFVLSKDELEAMYNTKVLWN